MSGNPTLLASFDEPTSIAKEQFRDIVLDLRPDWTDEEFERAWSEFMLYKNRI